MKKRLLSILLAICMVMAFLPTTAMASGEISSPGGGWCPGDPKKDNTITAFKELDENVKNQSVPYGTPLEALEWPTRLKVEFEGSVANSSVYDVTWAYETYDPNTPGPYVFTAQCDPEKFTFAEDVEMPTITVTVNEPAPPENTSLETEELAVCTGEADCPAKMHSEDCPLSAALRQDDVTPEGGKPSSLPQVYFGTGPSQILEENGVYSVSASTFEKTVTDVASSSSSDIIFVLQENIEMDSEGKTISFPGIEGKHVTLTSAENNCYSIRLSSQLEGDVTLDQVELKGPKTIYACGHIFETTGNSIVSVTTLYGGGPKVQDVMGDTELILRGGTFTNVFGGGLDSAVTGSVNILIDHPEVRITNLFGGGYAKETASGTVSGDVKLHIRQGEVHSPMGGGKNEYSVGDKNLRTPAAVSGTVYMIVGGEGVQKESAVVGGGVYTYAGSFHSTVGNVRLSFLEGAKPAGASDIHGCGYGDTVKGTVIIRIIGATMGPSNVVYGGGDDYYAYPDGGLGPSIIQNNSQEEYALQIFYDCEDDRADYGGMYHCICAGGNYHVETYIEGGVYLDVTNGKLDALSLDTDVPNGKNHIAGDSLVVIRPGAEIMRVTANVECYEDKCHTMTAIVDGGTEESPIRLGQINYFTNVEITESSHLTLDFNHYYFMVDKPFNNVSNLLVEKDAVLITENNQQARLLSSVTLRGTWEQRYVSGTSLTGDNGRSSADLRIGGSMTVEGGTLISSGTAHIYNNLRADGGTLVFKKPSIISLTGNSSRVFSVKETDIYLPAIKDTSFYPTSGQIPLAVGEKATGTANVYLFDGNYTELAEITDANLLQNYINAQKGMSDAVFVLANDSAKVGGYYFKRVKDAKKTTGAGLAKDYDMWQIAKDTTLTLYPENQTIYSGGKDGDGNNSEFPHPIYLVKNADGSFSELSGVTFQVNGTTWSGTGYPFTVKYYDADTNQEITDDQHYGDFTAKIVPVEGVEATDITTSDGRMVNFEEGTLRIRYVSSFTEAAKNTLTTDALEYTQETKETVKKQAESTGEAAVLLREDTKICLNGRSVYEYPVDASCQIALLFDELLPTRQGGDNQAYVDQLTAHAKEKGFDLTGKETLFRYLDLVDVNDSNAWVSSSEGSDVFWPYPGGTDRSTDFQLLHFEGLHREYSMDGAGSLSAQIEASCVVAITDFEKTDAGIWFHVVDSGFSPFALVWEKSGVTPPEGTVTVTFRVVNGTWSDGESVDRTYTIPEGTSLTGSGISVPAGMRPNSGYEGGSWDVTPNPALPLSSNVTYTYSFARSHVGGGGGDDGGKEYILKFDSNGGTEFDQIEEEHTFTVNPYEDSHYGDHIPVRTGYIFTGWYHDSGLTRRIDGDITVSGVKTIFAGWRETSVPAMLNGDDHYAYVIGFSDGSVCPYANITRAQVATIFFRLLTEDVRREYLTTANTFPDVNGDYWANTAISTMARLGVIHGRNSGLFDPNAPITRAEFAAICSRFDHSEVTAQSGLTDIAGHWAEEEIERAVALGWVQGFGDNTFRPNENITRAQAVTMINRVLNRLPETPADLLPGMNTWTDCHEGDWYYLAMQEATNSHDYQRKDTVYECWTCLNADPDWKQYE